MQTHSLFFMLYWSRKASRPWQTLSIKKAREIRFKPASRAFYVITLINLL